MPKPRTKASSCADCFIGKHKCRDRLSVTGCCSKCARHVRMELNNTHLSGKAASAFPYGVVSGINASSSPCPIETWGSEWNTFQVTVFTGDEEPPISMNFRSCGQFSTDNRDLMASLDSEVRRAFSASLGARKKGTNWIESAVLAGGYAHLLCSSSTTEMAESVQIVQDGVAGENMYGKWDLEIRLRRLIFHRIAELIDEVMEGIRLRPSEHKVPTSNHADAYAAAVILRIEVSHFRNCLRHGHLRGFLHSGLPPAFLQWLSSIEQELIDHVRDGCGRFPHWRSPIKGSVKRLRRSETILAVAIFMQHTTYSSLNDWTLDRHIPHTGSIELGYSTNSGTTLSRQSYAADQMVPITPLQGFDYSSTAMISQLPTSQDYATSTMYPNFGSDITQQVMSQPFSMVNFNMPIIPEGDTTPLDPRTVLSPHWTAISGQFFDAL